MADVAFRDAQLAQVFDPRVRVVNELCDALSLEKPDVTVPYVAPHYNAANATILSLSSNPGPRAGGDGGSGFLSRENDDPTAERMSQVFATVGLSDEHVLPWNAYPWYVHQAYPNGLPAGLLNEGLDPLKRLLELHPQIRTVVAHGGDAKRAMRQFTTKKRFAPFVAERSLKVWEARHTSNRAFIMDDAERATALTAICDTYRDAMAYVGVSAEIQGSDDAALTAANPKHDDTKRGRAVNHTPANDRPANARPASVSPARVSSANVSPTSVSPSNGTAVVGSGTLDSQSYPPSGALHLDRARTTASSGTELVIEVGDVLSGRTDGATDRETRTAVRAYLATMSPKRRTELLIELVTQRLNS
jgi:hypothetical protein